MTFIVIKIRKFMSAMYMPGATAVGITFDEGVVFASEPVSYTHLTLPTKA